MFREVLGQILGVLLTLLILIFGVPLMVFANLWLKQKEDK